MGESPVEMGRSIIDGSWYLTLATADASGKPWASPVWFAHDGYREFVWASKPDARHSTNIAVRPQVGIVIFDSTVGNGGAQAVYLDAEASELHGADRDRALRVLELDERLGVADDGQAYGAGAAEPDHPRGELRRERQPAGDPAGGRAPGRPGP